MVAGETGVLSLQLASEKPVYDIGIIPVWARPAMHASHTADHLLTLPRLLVAPEPTACAA